MGSIRASIELQDNFTNILMNVINAVNMSVSTMEQMQSVLNDPVDTSAIQGIRDQLNQATLAAQELEDAMQNIDLPDTSVPRTPVIIPREPSRVPATWQSNSLDVFTNSGMERFEQEVQSANNMLSTLNQTQAQIASRAAQTNIFPPNMAMDMGNIQGRLQAIQQRIQTIESSPQNMGIDTANVELEHLRSYLDQAVHQQELLNQAVENMDIQAANEAYLRLSQTIGNTEMRLRDNMDAGVSAVWRSDSVNVFTNSGMERFEQEVQSANNMLSTLNQTQAQIATRAAQTNIFPPNMAMDMGNMQSRLQAIQQRIQIIENNPLNMGTDTANTELEQLRSHLDQAVHQQELLNQAVENMDIQAANEAYLRLSRTIGNTEMHLRDNVNEQGHLNQEIEQGTYEAKKLMRMIGGVVTAYATIQTFSNVLDLSDTLASTTARLNMMNDGLQTTQDLQNMIYLSTERARGSYQATADSISKLGLMAGDAFASSQEIIDFMEQVNKQFRIAGTEMAGIDAAMLQLTQAMGSGVLRGEEYNSILEQAPNIIQSIADYLEVPKGQLKDMAAEGQITADIVKAAMFAAADETNAKFESMPMTFEQIFTSVENTALMALQPLLEKLNDTANSDIFKQFVSHAIDALSMLAAAANPVIEQVADTQALWDFANGAIDVLLFVGEAALTIFGLLAAGAQLLADNWSWLSPIIYGAVGALAVYGSYLAFTKGLELASAAAKGVMTIAENIYAAAIALTTRATMTEVAAQEGLNAAMYACPIVWIMVVIIALIALFYAAVAAVNHFAGTSVSATGIICGVFASAGAFIWNLVLGALELVMGILEYLINPFINFANFLANVFTNPVSSIIYLFQGMADTVLGLLQKIASALDYVFGSNMADVVQGWRDDIKVKADQLVAEYAPNENYQTVMDTLDFSVEDFGLERIAYSDAWDTGYSFGEGIDESIANFDLASLFGATDIPSADDYVSALTDGGIGSGIDDIAGNTGFMADDMDITEEELKYLRDMAEQETINRFTTARINIEQTNHNTIKNGMDLDGIVSGLTDVMNEAVESTVEGVHI